jgi:hypothetical protein
MIVSTKLKIRETSKDDVEQNGRFQEVTNEQRISY